MEEHKRGLGALTALDGVAPPPRWIPSIVHVIDVIWGRCNPCDREILAPLRWFLESRSVDLDVARANTTRSERPHDRAYEEYPVCVTLLKYNAKRAFAGLDRLILILLTVAVETGPASPGSARRIDKLAEIIRGALSDSKTPLRSLLEDVRSLPAFVRSVEAKLNDTSGESHPRFKSEWQSWIREAVLRWIHGDPEQLRAGIDWPELVQELDAPVLDVGSGASTDGDDGSRLRVATSTPATDTAVSAATHYQRAEALALVRQSYAELSRPPDQIVPVELIQRLLRATLASAREALATGDRARALDATAVLLSAATSIRESQLACVAWGGEASETARWVVDPELPVMYRHVSMPPNAVKPGGALDGWLRERTDVMQWPLSPSVHNCLRHLAPNGKPETGKPVLLGWSDNGPTHQRLWEACKRIDPSVRVAPGQLREVLAAHLAGRLGPEVAQLLLGDTFTMSPAPSYYCAVSEQTVVGVIANVLDEWFDTKVRRTGSDATIGSRLALRAERAKEWPGALRREMRLTVRHGTGQELDGWVAHRNRLAAAFCAVTGVRPGEWMGTLDLDQLVPEYALAIVSDKASDELRGFRVVALGQRWVADFRDFIDRLGTIAGGALGEKPAAIATRILRSEAPLFTVANASGDPESFSLAVLVATMPEPLRTTPNHYRHRLNQYLQRAGIDPELRHGQMGWVVTPAHALADLSPWSAKTFAAKLAPVLDQFMIGDGWYPNTQRTHPWTWRSVPERAPKDWAEVARSYQAQRKDDVKIATEKLRKRWENLADDVLTRLASAIDDLFPLLKVDVAKKRIEYALDLKGQSAVPMTAGHYELLCDRVRLGDKSPEDATETLATRIMLYRLIRRARERGLVDGPIPGRPYLRGTHDLSPFIPGLGLAIRHVEEIRSRLVTWAARNPVKYADSVAAAAVLTSSAYRREDLALGAVAAATAVQRSAAHPDCVRLAANVDHKLVPMVLGGLPAVAVARRANAGPRHTAPTGDKLATNLRHILSDGSKAGGAFKSMSSDAFVALCQAAGRLELSGPERAVMLGDATLAAVSVQRCVARDDDWPLRSAVSRDGASEPDAGPLYEDRIPVEQLVVEAGRRTGVMLQREYHRLTKLLNPDTFAQLAGGKSDGRRGWRGKLRRRLIGFRQEIGECRNVGLLAGFALHRLRFGGHRERNLSHVTLRNDVTRFAADLIAIAGASSILQWEAAEFRDNYLAVLVGKSDTARRQAFDALAVFHRYLMNAYGVCEAPLAELQAFAGERVSAVDPGMITLREARAVLDVLHADLAAVQVKLDAMPDQIRLLKLRILIFLLLEASGARPSSVYGLTLGDLVMIGSGRDYIRIRETGAYGQAKTKTSIGFVPLEGPIWESSRDWVAQWIADERKVQTASDWWDVPLFASRPGERRRFRRAHLTGRIDQLLKWASSRTKARCYWLRKNRVTARIEAVETLETPTAHAMYGALHASGHAGILVPLSSYISDPRVSLSGQVREGRSVARATILSITGLNAAQLDTAWRRAGGADSVNRLSVVMHRLGIEVPRPPAELMTTPPALAAAKPLLPDAIHRYATARHATVDHDEAVLRSGLTLAQTDRLDALAGQLAVQRGIAPWRLTHLRGKHLAMDIPRRLVDASSLFKLLNSAPDRWLSCLANAWAEQPHVQRLYGKDVVLCLRSITEREAGRELISSVGSGFEMIQRDGAGLLVLAGHAAPAKSHAAAVAWLFAMVWLYERVRGEAIGL
jgi:hypothetical protein